MEEVWKPIPGYEGRYEVSNCGRVKSVAFMQRYVLRNGVEAYRRTHERVLSTQQQNSGYTIVHLHMNGQRKASTVHALVAYVFLPAKPTAAHEVNHLDGDKTNNSTSNLAWVTRSENHKHAYRTGLRKHWTAQ